MVRIERNSMKVHESQGSVVSFERMHDSMHLLIALNFAKDKQVIKNDTGISYTKIFDSSDALWNGTGGGSCTSIQENSVIEMNPLSAVVYEKNV